MCNNYFFLSIEVKSITPRGGKNWNWFCIYFSALVQPSSSGNQMPNMKDCNNASTTKTVQSHYIEALKASEFNQLCQDFLPHCFADNVDIMCMHWDVCLDSLCSWSFQKIWLDPTSLGRGCVCGQNICYYAAANVVSFNLICNMTIFWKSLILTSDPTP